MFNKYLLIGVGFFIFAVGSSNFNTAFAAVSQDSVGDVRVQFLTSTLVRLEKRSALGSFEDRKTYVAIKRDWPAVQFTKEVQGATTIFKTSIYEVHVPSNGSQISGVFVKAGGQTVYTYNGEIKSYKLFPPPHQLGGAWVIGDNPRVCPPEWGATPMPDGALDPSHPLYNTKGWDYRSNLIKTPDVYVFVNSGNGLESWHTIRKDFLTLTGPTPMLPLYVLGFITSRWYPYTQDQFVARVKRFRDEKIPLDMLVVDTDWRQGVSTYAYETRYFWDVAKFYRELDDLNCRVMYNDHPQGSGTDYKGFYKEHTKKYDEGLDAWWYDRNWGGIIGSPVGGIDRETWGSRLFFDIMQKHLPNKRAYTMAMRTNTPQQNEKPKSEHGNNYQPHVSHHRYPIWWTGDIRTEWVQLRQGVITIVDDGINFLPWNGTDIAGFYGTADPGDELYTRWMEMGCFTPHYRIHGTNYGNEGLQRYPWQFSNQTKEIVTRYIKLRYRLLPMIYEANYRTFNDGTPICKRLDFEYSGQNSARSNEQYLFGQDLLVRPCTERGSTMSSGKNVTVWVPPGDWFDAWTGKKETGPKNVTVNSKLWHTPIFVRQGAVICLAPEMQYSSEKAWDPIILDVFPPKSGKITRVLYEDDKESPKYLQNKFCKTAIDVDRQAGGFRVTVGKMVGDYTSKLTNRAWIVRLHLDAAHTNQAIKVQGTPVAVGTAWTHGTQPEARKHDQTNFPSPITPANFPLPFNGEGSKPGPDAPGPVIEVWLPKAATSGERFVEYGTYTGITYRNSINLKDMFRVISHKAGNRTLQVQFALPAFKETKASHRVTITAYDAKGRAVKTLVNSVFSPGYHRVAVDNNLGTGMYMCTLSIDNMVRGTLPLLLIK